VSEPDSDKPVGSPFGTSELLAAVQGAGRILDAGCGSGRLTVELAKNGAAVTGIDTSEAHLRAARTRAADAGVSLQLRVADFNEPLPFDDGSFDAVTNRLSLMAADDPTSTLQEFRRILKEGGHVTTAVWSSLSENSWFSAAREAIATVLGPERAA